LAFGCGRAALAGNESCPFAFEADLVQTAGLVLKRVRLPVSLQIKDVVAFPAVVPSVGCPIEVLVEALTLGLIEGLNWGLIEALYFTRARALDIGVLSAGPASLRNTVKERQSMAHSERDTLSLTALSFFCGER
jgi:hypothetical protein